jgi:hypothetical protein
MATLSFLSSYCRFYNEWLAADALEQASATGKRHPH